MTVTYKKYGRMDSRGKRSGSPTLKVRSPARHLGYMGLERKIEMSERKAHPNYSRAHVRYIAKATAGEIARKKRGF